MFIIHIHNVCNFIHDYSCHKIVVVTCDAIDLFTPHEGGVTCLRTGDRNVPCVVRIHILSF